MFEVRSFSTNAQPVQRPVVVGDNALTQPARRDDATTVRRDTFESSNAVGVSYPTVGEYVKQQFSEKLDGALTGLHLVAETMPPVLIAEIGAIHLKHREAALKEVWNLPMDPQGKWKTQAAAIMDRQAKLASAEVRQLPLIDTVSHLTDHVGTGFAWLGNQIKAGARAVVNGVSDSLQAAGRAIRTGATYAVDGMVSTGVAVGKGVEQAGIAIQNGSRAAGVAIKQAGTSAVQSLDEAYQATVQGISWVGTQAVELPKAAARTVVHGIGGVGQGMVDFSSHAEPLFAPAN